MNNKAKALLRRYKERREKLRIAGCLDKPSTENTNRCL